MCSSDILMKYLYLQTVTDDDAPPPAPRGRGTRKAPASRTAPPSSRASTSTRAAPASTASGASNVNCECGVTAALRTSQTEHSMGRQFYACGNDRKCDFFQWADAPPRSTAGVGPSTSAPRAPPPSRVQSTNAAAGSSRLGADNDGGERKCKCNIPAIQRQVVKEGQNKGRMFWTCSKSQDEQCGYFEWDDDQGGGGGGGAGTSSSGTRGAGGGITCFGVSSSRRSNFSVLTKPFVVRAARTFQER